MWYLCYLWYLCISVILMYVQLPCGTCAWLIIICRWSPRQTDAGSQLQHKSRFHLCSRHRHLRHYRVFRRWWWIKRSIAIFLICSTPTLVAENEAHWPLAPGGWLADTSAMILRGLSRCHLCNLRMVINQWFPRGRWRWSKVHPGVICCPHGAERTNIDSMVAMWT